jgi:dTDP-4-amino-4,6-dideoxygalactose transaminase
MPATKSPHRLDAVRESFSRLIEVSPPELVFTRTASEGFLCLLLALDTGPGDEVVLPISICQTMVNAAILSGATPVMADCDPDLAMDAEALRRCITTKTRVVVFHQPLGLACDLTAIRQVLEAQGTQATLVEDVTQAIGATCGGKVLGQSAEVALYSFGATKPLSAGIGGAVWVKDATLRERILRTTSVGTPGWPDDRELGWNSSLGDGDLKRIDAAIAAFPALLRERMAIVGARIEVLARFASVLHGHLAGQFPLRHVFHRVIVEAPAGNARQIADELEGMVRERVAALCQPAVPVSPVECGFVQSRYQRLGRPDLCRNPQEQFPTWFELANKYLYIRTNDGLTHEEFACFCHALEKAMCAGRR